MESLQRDASAQPEIRVGAHQAITACPLRQGRPQSISVSNVKFGHRPLAFGASASDTAKPVFAVDRQLRHRDPFRESWRRSFRLQRLRANRGKQHCIQPERRASRSRNRQMPQVRRVEASPKECTRDPPIRS